MPKKTDNELEKFQKVVELLRQLYKDDHMKILVAPDGVSLKIEEEALEKHLGKGDLPLEEAKALIRDEVSMLLNSTMGDYSKVPPDMLPPPSKEKEKVKKRASLKKSLQEKIGVLKETEEEWNIAKRAESKLGAKTSVIAEIKWEVCQKVADERKTKRDSTPFATIEIRHLDPPFRPPPSEVLRMIAVSLGEDIEISNPRSISLRCDKEDIRYLIGELKKIEKELSKSHVEDGKQ